MPSQIYGKDTTFREWTFFTLSPLLRNNGVINSSLSLVEQNKMERLSKAQIYTIEWEMRSSFSEVHSWELTFSVCWRLTPCGRQNSKIAPKIPLMSTLHIIPSSWVWVGLMNVMRSSFWWLLMVLKTLSWQQSGRFSYWLWRSKLPCCEARLWGSSRGSQSDPWPTAGKK